MISKRLSFNQQMNLSKQGGALKYKAKNLGVLYIHQKEEEEGVV
jgi:hypothetical protein